MRILVAAASKHGSTWEIAQAIGDTLAARGIHVNVEHIEDVHDISGYDGFVIGSAVYRGRWLKQAVAFARQHAASLRGRPIWLFSSGPLGAPLKPTEGRAVDIGPIAKLIRIKEHRILAGKLTRHHIGWMERAMSSIVHAQHGDFRNWEEIRAWAGGIAQTLKRQRVMRHTLLQG